MKNSCSSSPAVCSLSRKRTAQRSIASSGDGSKARGNHQRDPLLLLDRKAVGFIAWRMEDHMGTPSLLDDVIVRDKGFLDLPGSIVSRKKKAGPEPLPSSVSILTWTVLKRCCSGLSCIDVEAGHSFREPLNVSISRVRGPQAVSMFGWSEGLGYYSHRRSARRTN